MSNSPAPSRRGAKIVAIASAAALAAVGGALSIAAWTDAEWLSTSAGSGDDGVGTSTFEIEQAAFDPAAGSFGAFGSYESETAPNVVTFDVVDLVPDEPSYGLVALTTTADSIAGTLDLDVATDGSATADPQNAALFAATDIEVWTWNAADMSAPPACDGTTAADGTATSLGAGDLGTVDPTGAQPLVAAGGDVQFYCFELTFAVPAGDAPEDYMGLELRPVWSFESTSS